MNVEIKRWAIFGASLSLISLAIGYILYAAAGTQMAQVPGVVLAAISVFLIPMAMIVGAIEWIIAGNTIYNWLFKKYSQFYGLWGTAIIVSCLLALLVGTFEPVAFAISTLIGGAEIYLTIQALKFLKIKWW